LKIIPFKIEHALSLNVRPVDEKIKDHPDFEKWAKLNEDSIGFSGFYNDALIGCAGVRKLWDGVGEAWLLCSQDIVKVPVSAIKNIKNYLDKIIRKQGFWRVQAHVRVDNPVNIKFIQMFGFKVEAKMEKFNPDKTDSYLFAKVIK